MKISGIGPWMCRIDWSEGHWCGLTYMVVRLSDITSKTGKKCFCAYIGQPHNHTGWTTSMTFASINPTKERTNLWYFHKKNLRICDFEKLSFFESAILNFFYSKKKIFFASFPWKSVQICMVEWMGRNLDVFPGFQKIPCYA